MSVPLCHFLVSRSMSLLFNLRLCDCFCLDYCAFNVFTMHIINYSLISSHNNQHKPPCHVDDLIEGLQDGTKLLALLEVLSGERLVCYHS